MTITQDTSHLLTILPIFAILNHCMATCVCVRPHLTGHCLKFISQPEAPFLSQEILWGLCVVNGVDDPFLLCEYAVAYNCHLCLLKKRDSGHYDNPN